MKPDDIDAIHVVTEKPNKKKSQSSSSSTGSGSSSNSISTIKLSQHQQQDYSYAYYEPGAAMRHSNVPLPEGVTNPPPNSIRALLSKGKKNKLLVSQALSQSYQKRFMVGGTSKGSPAKSTVTSTMPENFYEEIAAANSANVASTTTNVRVEEEFRKVQCEHRKILGELNLAVEAMLMPDSNSSQDSSNEVEEVSKQYVFNDEDFTTGNHAVGGDLDSGFSGSSGASYIGHLRMQKTNMRSRRQDSQSEEEQTFFPQPLFRHKTLINFKSRQTDDISPFVKTESKARSFWNKKGWKRNSSIESIERIGLEGEFFSQYFLFSICLFLIHLGVCVLAKWVEFLDWRQIQIIFYHFNYVFLNCLFKLKSQIEVSSCR